MPLGVWVTKMEGGCSRLDVWGIPEHQEKNISLRVKGGNTFVFDHRAHCSHYKEGKLQHLNTF